MELINKTFRIRSFARSIAIGVVAVSIAVGVALAVTPTNGGMAGGILSVVDSTPGDQTYPNVSGDLAAYTDMNSGRIRFYIFLNPGSFGEIPASAAGDIDTLSGVDGTRISFARRKADGSRACMVFDAATSTTIEIAPGSGLTVSATAIGGDTVAFMSQSDIMVARISAPAAPPLMLSGPGEFNTSPAVSPSGSAVVWERCDASSTNCAVMKSTASGGVWSAAQVVADTGFQEQNPDTDGTFVVYDSDRPISTGGADIYFQALAGGPETQLSIGGTERNPSVSQGVIAFESFAPGPTAADLFVYVIATNTLWRVTDTPAYNEGLSDVSVLPDGNIRVIWTADDDLGGARNIYARTFSVTPADATPPAITIASPANGSTYARGQSVLASFSCADEPGGSGLAACTGTVANGGPINTTTVGSYSFVVTSTDNAGNIATATHTYNVRYSFSGFLQPIENLPTLNVANGGGSIPVRFSLGGSQGLAIFAPGFPASSPIACDENEPGVLIEETATAGNSTLNYNAASDQYSYIWKTEKAWKGTCRMLIFRFDDGTQYLAKFRFK